VHRLPRLVLALAVLLAGAAPVLAQAPAAAEPEPGSELSVFVITMGPGDMVWERFGHNALWIHDPVRGTDHAYNWGLFSFEQENFLLRFVQGRMLYSMAPFPADRTVASYVDDDRTVIVQELNLTPRQRLELREFLEWNEQPANRDYHYDYYQDNCSTRVRDAIDRVLGGQLRAQTTGILSGTTFRSHTARLTSGDIPIYTGLMLGLGQPVDREISRWEEMFLPMRMSDHLRQVMVEDASGQRIPLVRSEQVVYEATRAPIPERPRSMLLGYLLAGLLLAGALVGLGQLAPGNAAARFGFAALSSLWLLLAGTLGVVLAGLWAFTDHAAAYRNENLLHFSPLALALVLLVPLVAYGARWAVEPARWVAWALVGLSVLGVLLKALPQFHQGNAELIALALPIHLALAWSIEHMRREHEIPAAAHRPRRQRVA
jgi:hypothetical protein